MPRTTHCPLPPIDTARLGLSKLFGIISTMATLAAIQKQIADLERQAEAIRTKEAAAAAAKARELISTYKLSIDDLGLGGKAERKGAASKGKAGPTAGKRKVAAAKPAGTPKYQDPKSGKTWTGTGKPPGWIASAKNRDKFLIVAAAAVPAAPAAVPKAGKPSRVAGRAAGKKVAVASKPNVAKPSAKAARAAASVAVPPLATRKPGAKRKPTQAAGAAAGAAKALLATAPAATT